MINVRINDEPTQLKPRITVVGVGGAGGNAVNNMIRSGLEGCEFLVCNTDAQALQQSLADRQIQLGTSVTRGLGAGARPDVGRAAAEESLDEIINVLDGSNMVFITCGLGGGTGSGAAPVIARAARDQGILTVGVATKPFHFEGTNRMRLAEEALKDLQQYVDTLIVIPNQNLFRVANEKTTFADAFKMADDVLQAGVRGVTDLMVMPGLINLDFADVKAVMAEMGKAMMGTGEATGERRATEAAEAAISNPILDDISMKGAKGVLINITGGMDMTLFEVDEAANRIRDEVDPDANIIFGSTFDEAMEGKMRVSVVATGIDQEQHVKSTTPSNVRPVQAVSRQSQSTGYAAQRTSVQPASQPVQAQAAQRIEQQPEQHYAQATVAENTTQQRSIVTPNGHHIPPAGTPFPSIEERIVETAAQVTQVQEPVYAQQNGSAYATRVSGSSVKGGMYQTQTHGQRLQGAFIPPQPVTVDTSDAHTAVEEVAQAPARPAQAPAEQKKAPTLFERLTGSVSSRIREEEKADKIEPSFGHAQKTLGIEQSQGDDELDIPAFLRRQTN